MRFKPHPSGILIGKTYKIRNWKPELFSIPEPETIETINTWNKTDELINNGSPSRKSILEVTQ